MSSFEKSNKTLWLAELMSLQKLFSVCAQCVLRAEFFS